MISDFWFFPMWTMVFMFLFIILLLIFWLWAIIDCLTSKLAASHKLLWLVVIIFFNLIGALLYFIFSKNVGKEIMKTKGFRGKRLYRSKSNKIIAGVCGGIGKYFGVDPVLVRLLWVLFTLMGGAGILAYIITWIIIPKEK